MIDPEMLKNLLNGPFSSLTIGYNDDHACNYVDAAGWADEFGGYLADEDDRIDWVSEDERLKAIRENSVWTIQWYPNTPVGFNCVGASTFEAAARAALETLGGDQ